MRKNIFLLVKVKLPGLLLFLLSTSYSGTAQLTISPGALFFAGKQALALQNSNFINNGNFNADSGTVSFTGNFPSSVSGDQAIQFFDLQVAKTNNAAILLQRNVGVKRNILFSSGLLNLNGFNTDLGATGSLVNENENSRVIGSNGGQVQLSASLNAPLNANPGNLGAIFTSNENLGPVVIARGHQALAVSGLGANSILRYYDIFPANNAN